MKMFGPVVVAVVALSAAAGCQQKPEKSAPSPSSGDTAAVKPAQPPAPPKRPAVEQIKPSIDIKTPPADAVKLPSGMVYKRLTTKDGATPLRNDTVVIHFTGWKTSTGETFNTTRTRGKPMPLDLATAGPGFAEVFTQVRQGETVMMWMPAALVNAGGGGGTGGGEALAFEAEVVAIEPAPAVPADVAAPPADAKRTRGGLRYVVLKPGTGTERARFFDTAKFRYTLWDGSGKMLSSTDKRSRPVSSALYRQPQPLEEIMTTMVVGQRDRFWVDAAKMGEEASAGGTGQLCYELELIEITKGKQPPPTPKDVKAPPRDAAKSAGGVWYRVLKPGKGGARPTATDTVEVHYTGWTVDGRMFDSSVVRGETTKFPLGGVIKGWSEGIPLMQVGEVTRFWIPEELAYKGAPNNPQGMLVFDVELVSFGPAQPSPHGEPAPGMPGGELPGAGHDGHGH